MEVVGLSIDPLTVVSVHTMTGVPKGGQVGAFDALSAAARARLPKDSGSWNAHIIMDVVAKASTGGRFVIGGDFNVSWRFDETQDSHWASDQFRAMRKHVVAASTSQVSRRRRAHLVPG